MFTSRTVRSLLVMVSGVVLAGATAGAQTILYVDADATETPHDGSSWANAYNDLQGALAEASTNGAVEEIRVAQGVYRPDCMPDSCIGTNGDRQATFQLLDDVALRGGYAGWGEPDPDFRDIDSNATILSGDLNDDDAGTSGIDENSYHVVTGSGTDETAILDGFTITAGNADGSQPHRYGGGMYNSNGSPALTDCTFSGNSADWGGGMYCDNYSSPTLTYCTFSDNSAVDGGGMCNGEPSSPTLTNCTFTGNSASDGGGGMYNFFSSPTLTNCTFTGNSAGWWGGGMRNDGSSPTLTNCTFTGNSADTGGGMSNFCCYGGPTLTNCTFTGNSASTNGGGMCNIALSNPSLTNCTFSGNSASDGGGIYNGGGSSTLTNCILWGNTPDEIFDEAGSQTTVTCSDVRGGWAGPGNIDSDPLFVDSNGVDDIPGTQDDDLRLLPGSPCIDAGTNEADTDANTPGVQPLPDFDLDGRPRFVDDPLTPDTGCCFPPIVDMGAYEFQDCNGNGIPDDQELTLPEVLLAADFETGLPGDWFASGLWHVTDECITTNACDPPHWAYFGQDGNCTFDTGAQVQGELTAAAVLIPDYATGATLTYCSIYDGERGSAGDPPWGFDRAWVTANGTLVDDVGPSTLLNEWVERTVDLGDFVGESVVLAWHFDSVDANNNDMLGWQVDAIELAAEGVIDNDCNTNGIPDECDVALLDCNTNGVPDDCDVDPADPDGDGYVSEDCNTNGVPDECDPDFDGDGLIDDCDPDIDDDGVPNEEDACDFTPPGAPIVTDPQDPLYGTLRHDSDGDCDVDLEDYATLQQEFTGPNP